jgi:hypothetical protein
VIKILFLKKIKFSARKIKTAWPGSKSSICSIPGNVLKHKLCELAFDKNTLDMILIEI